YSYPVEVKSKKGSAKFRLDAGPPGMQVTNDGRVQWDVPLDFGVGDTEAIVHVSDASAQDLDQASTLRVIDRSAAPPPGPAPPLDADPLRRASSPAPAPLANSGLRPVKLPQPKVVKPLPST